MMLALAFCAALATSTACKYTTTGLNPFFYNWHMGHWEQPAEHVDCWRDESGCHDSGEPRQHFSTLLQQELAHQRHQQLQAHQLQQRARRQQLRKQEHQRKHQRLLREQEHQARLAELLEQRQEKQHKLQEHEEVWREQQRRKYDQQLKRRQQLKDARQHEVEKYIAQRRLLEAAEQRERENTQKLEPSQHTMDTMQTHMHKYDADAWTPFSTAADTALLRPSAEQQISTWVEKPLEEEQEEEELDYDELAREVVSSVPVRERGERAEWGHRTGWGRKEDTGRRFFVREARPFHRGAGLLRSEE